MGFVVLFFLYGIFFGKVFRVVEEGCVFEFNCFLKEGNNSNDLLIKEGFVVLFNGGGNFNMVILK